MTLRVAHPASAEVTAQQTAELAAMHRMLLASRGSFSLSLAVCNSPALRDYLIERLHETFPEITVVSLTKDANDPYGFVVSQLNSQTPEALCIIDIERIIPSESKGQPALRSLNASRELWAQRFHCPVVFWLPEYSVALLSTHARDFYRYRSHRFEFVSEFATVAAGIVDQRSGDLDAASNLTRDEKHFRIAELEQRLADAVESPEPELLVHALAWLNENASLHGDLGEFDEAERLWRRMEDLARQSSSDEDLANAYGNIGNVKLKRGELESAESMHLRALEIDRKLGLLEGMANNYGNLGNVMLARGDLDAAETMCRAALNIDKDLNRLEGMATDYGNLGNVMFARGDHDEAEAMYCKALDIYEKLGRYERMAIQFGNLASIKFSRGDLDGATKLYHEGLEIMEKLGHLEAIATFRGNLGNVFCMRGNLDATEALYRSALEINEKLGRLEGIAIQIGNLGILKELRGDMAGARDFWTKAREMYVQLGLKDKAKKLEGWIDKLPA